MKQASAVLKHVVLLQFKSGSGLEDVARVESAFAALATQIDEVRSIEWGTNCSLEELDRGYTHCFVLAFADMAARDRYLTHPCHLAFSEFARPFLENVLVIDYRFAGSPS
jgi:hypothetical protein